MEGLELVMHHFYFYPLITKKKEKYLLFKELFKLKYYKKNPTLVDFNKQVSVLAPMGIVLAGKLQKYICSVPAPRP